MEHVSRLRFMDVDRTRLPVRPRQRSRGVPNALQEHPLLDTLDPAEAVGVVSQLVGPVSIHPADGWASRFHCRLHAVAFLDVAMAHLDLTVPATVHVRHSPECYTVHMTSAGHASVEVGGTTHELSPFFALVVSPGTSYAMHLAADSPQTIVRIERAAVERQLSRMLGRQLPSPVVFQPVGDLTSDAASRWHGALQILSSEVLNPGSLIHQGVGATALEELIISTLLYVHDSNYSESLRTRTGRSGRVAVRRSVEYIESHLAEPIRLRDLSEYSEMSPRSIQVGFREDLGTTPVAYIRERRLEAVRRTLMEAAPRDRLTVTEAATRWGFTHLGSFSVLYRQRFGESPSHTLRGSRGA